MSALQLVASIIPMADASQYLDKDLKIQGTDPNFDVRKMGLLKRIWRAVVSFFHSCFGFSNSDSLQGIVCSKTDCLRASFIAIHNKIKDSKDVPPKVQRIFNLCFPSIQTMPEPELKITLKGLEEALFPGSALLKEHVSMPVQTTLEELFKNSLHPLKFLPLYSSQVVAYPQREQMTSPIMAGFLGRNDDSRPFIAIAVDRVSDQPNPSNKGLIVLYQRCEKGKLAACQEGSLGENLWWNEDKSPSDPYFLSSGKLTCPSTGKIVKSQEAAFASFQKFLETGEGTDLRGVKWKIASPTVKLS